MSSGQWTVSSTMDSVMTWNYDVERVELRALYEKAKKEQWNATTHLDWTQDVDPESLILDDDLNPNVALLRDSDIWRRMTPQEQTRLRYETLAWNLSQFLHGEQLAIFVAGQLTAAVPWIDAKLYGSTQVMDEARHAEVFYRYLNEKLEHHYPLSDTTRGIFETILSESRWDLKYLGLQVILEGLAMGLFTRMYQGAQAHLLRDLRRLVRKDEARHFAFGVLSLRDFYAEQMTEAERTEREDFAFEVCQIMRGRTYPKEAWESMGLPVDDCLNAMREAARHSQAQLSAFTRVTAALKTIGMLSERMRPHYAQLGLLKYEDAPLEEIEALAMA
ncbi:MAG: ferritin-like domain-containing protein [bacterium]|nr:ferritin-like domain-containing protein [bacterium]